MASSKSRCSASVLSSLSSLRHFQSTSSPNFSVHGSSSPSRNAYSYSANFDFARSVSPKTNLQARRPVSSVPPNPVRKMCLCSPSNHPGAFRCSLHRNCPTSSASPNSQLQIRRSAMKNSIVRIGSMEGGEWVKRALTSNIRPSSHQLRRRTSFRPQPSRLRHVTRAEDVDFS
ncbi:hypothetical protein SUGI_0506400 [Cryptomeria japonica]|uniref:uncharacterized protein LOC131066167 n=1 Tax=Cryptomeria japonica TaxID=3369 RepID=UPI002408EC56|nr:uncharacterized protein LOC131066167 [Cryptomeria japonica]GLJ26324.1 hypothetical protein SUGI_0506400 [Cryptomeria japonica]